MDKYAILFPGQGSQEKGMGRDLAEASNDAKELWIMAEKASSLPLREIYWDGEAADMADTRALQPALTAVNLSVWFYLKNKLSPAAAAGHSLGEFSALAAAGVLSPVDTLELTSLRGRLMSEAGGEGESMAALVKIDQERAEDIVKRAGLETGELLLTANYNSPAQFVISGKSVAVEAASRMAKEQKARAVPLAVSGAFHSPLMDEAAREFASALAKKDFSQPLFDVYFNVTAFTEQDPGAVRDIVSRQMTSSVKWLQTVENMWNDGFRGFFELGPKNVLTKLMGANLKGRDGDWAAENIGGLEAAEALKNKEI